MWIIPQTDHHEVAIEMAKNRRLCWHPILVPTTIASQKCCWRHAGDHSMSQPVCVAREDPMGMESNSCKQLQSQLIRWELEENQGVPWPVLQKRCIKHLHSANMCVALYFGFCSTVCMHMMRFIPHIRHSDRTPNHTSKNLIAVGHSFIAPPGWNNCRFCKS